MKTSVGRSPMGVFAGRPDVMDVLAGMLFLVMVALFLICVLLEKCGRR